MSIRLEVRARRATLIAWVAVVCAAVVALLAAAAKPAFAYTPCPTNAVPAGDIVEWDTKWPTPGADPKGIAQCLAMGTTVGKGYLQIVDLRDGARVHLLNGIRFPLPRESPLVNTLYDKKTAKDWYDAIRSGAASTFTWRDRLFSTTNASFFKDSNNSNPTKLPFPEKDGGNTFTYGVAMNNTADPDHRAPKSYLTLTYGLVPETGEEVQQQARVGLFPTYYNKATVDSYLGAGATNNNGSALVSFDPRFAIGTTSRRNYLGVHNQRVYIFTSVAEYTSLQAYNIMQQIEPGMSVIQLDGGGSAQTHSAYANVDSSIPVLNRTVPDVLAVYRAR